MGSDYIIFNTVFHENRITHSKAEMEDTHPVSTTYFCRKELSKLVVTVADTRHRSLAHAAAPLHDALTASQTRKIMSRELEHKSKQCLNLNEIVVPVLHNSVS